MRARRGRKRRRDSSEPSESEEAPLKSPRLSTDREWSPPDSGANWSPPSAPVPSPQVRTTTAKVMFPKSCKLMS